MGDVVSTARRIRRRRRLRTGAATVAVVAALATPFVVAATNGSDGADGPFGPTDSSSIDAAPRVRLADVRLGQPPAVAWIDGSDYVAADGTRTTLPLDHVTRATPYRSGFLVTVYGDNHVILLDSRLHEVWRRCTQGGFAVSQDGLRTAYSTGGCEGSDAALHVGPTSGTGDEQTRPMPLAPASPVGMLGDGRGHQLPQRGTAVAHRWRWLVVRVSTQLSRAEGVDERLGLVSGQLAGVQQPTGAVIDASTGSVTWSEPGWALQSFSPDGSMVVGVRIEGGAPRGWRVFDAESGKQLHEFATPAGFEVTRVVWEGDEHLLMTTTQGRSQAILRTTLDGAIQLATAAAPYNGGTMGLRYGLAPSLFP